MPDPRPRSSALVVAAILVAAQVPACGGGDDADTWVPPARPPRPALTTGDPWPLGPPVRARELRVGSWLGPAVSSADALWVPTGRGVARAPAGDSTAAAELATPGWAAAVLAVDDGVAWVADGHAGITVVRWVDGGLRLDRSWTGDGALGRVVDLAAAGPHVLALSEDGWLLALVPGEDGAPREVARLTMDGTPWDVEAWPDGAGWAWIVSAQEGGLIPGHLRPAGELRQDPPLPIRPYVYGVAGGPDGVVSTRPTGRLVAWPAEDTLGSLPSYCRSATLASDGVPWFACDRAGLFRGRARRDEAAAAIRQRSGAYASAVTPAGAPGQVLVSWSDGVVERLDSAGNVMERWAFSDGDSVQGVSGGWLLLTDASRTTHRLESVDRVAILTLEAGPMDLAGSPPLLSMGERGLLRLAPDAADAPGLERLADGVFYSCRDDADGGWWCATKADGLVRLDADGRAMGSWLSDRGSSMVSVSTSPDWVAAVEVDNGGFLAVRRTNPDAPVIQAHLPGKGCDIVIHGDTALVGVTWWGVAAVPLGEETAPAIRTLRLERPRIARATDAHLCPTPGGALVTLGELGLAVVALDGDGAPVLRRLVDTPGFAVDCAATADPTVYLVADTTGLIELTIPLSEL